MEYRWGFDIRGMSWVDSLSWSAPGPDVAIFRDEEDDRPPVYVWTSRHLTDLSDIQAVGARAAALKRLFDGAMYLSHGEGFNPEPLSELVDLTQNRWMGRIDLTPGPAPFSRRILAAPLTLLEQRLVTSEVRILEPALYLARRDPLIRGGLAMLGGQGVSFLSLYALRDFMKTGGMTDGQIADAAGCSDAELKRLLHTANSFEAAGVDARHGAKGQAPPPNPMPLADAADLTLRAFRRFLTFRRANH